MNKFCTAVMINWQPVHFIVWMHKDKIYNTEWQNIKPGFACGIGFYGNLILYLREADLLPS